MASDKNNRNTIGNLEEFKVIDSTNAPYFITICSGKGGVGKSVLAANLAYALSGMGNRVLIWDADMHFPNQHLLNGVEPPVRLKDVYYERCSLNSAKFRLSDNLYLLADMPATGYDEDFNPSSYLNVYEQIVNSGDIDIVIIDTPAGDSFEVLQCCSFSDLIKVVITDEPTSLLDAYGLIKVLMQYIELEKIKILVNNVIDSEDAEDFSSKLNAATRNFLKVTFNVFGFVPYDRAVRQSILQQEPFAKCFPESEASAAIFDIAEKLAEFIKVNNIK